MAASAKSAVASSLPSPVRAAVSTATDCGRSILRSMIRWPSRSIPRARCRCWTTGIIAYERSSDGGKIAGGAPSLPARQDGRDARRSTDACLLPLQLPSAWGGLFFDCWAARKLLCLVHPRPCPRGQQPIAHLYMPVHPAVAGHIKREFQPGPHSQFVEGGAQVVLHHCSLVSRTPAISSLVSPCQTRIAT